MGKGVQKSVAPLEVWLAGGGHPGWGPGIGFAGLATRLLPCGFLSQVRGDHAAGGLGTLQVLWGLQHCGRKWESGLPKKAAHSPAWGRRGGGGWLPQGTPHFHRSCHWKWNPGGPEPAGGSSGGWPRVNEPLAGTAAKLWLVWADGDRSGSPWQASAQDRWCRRLLHNRDARADDI